MIKTLIALTGLLTMGRASAADAGLLEKQSQKLLAAYEILVDHHNDIATFAPPQSSCQLDVCAVNFITDNENLGFYAQMISELEAYPDGSPIIAFAVLPEGATFQSILPVIELPKGGRVLASDKLQIIGDRVQNALGILGWVGFDSLQNGMSECRAVATSVTCRLNFHTDREPFGVMVQGYLNTMDDDLMFVSGFETDTNGV